MYEDCYLFFEYLIGVDKLFEEVWVERFKGLLKLGVFLIDGVVWCLFLDLSIV